MGDHLAEKSFAVYGLNVPRIVRVLPTNLPIIEANELRLDHLFELADGSLALVDYESKYADENKLKYLSYIVRTLKKEWNAGQNPIPGRQGKSKASCPRIRMLVIYTADVRPDQASSNLDAGCLQLEIEQAFLTGLDSAAVEAELREKISHKVPLTGEDQMRFIILPLTLKGTSAKQECIRRCFDMARDIEDEQTQVFLLSGLLTFSDKVITVNDSIMIQEWIKMTKVGRLFELERLEYGRQKEIETARDIAANLLQNGISADLIIKSITLLSREEVAELQKSMAKS